MRVTIIQQLEGVNIFHWEDDTVHFTAKAAIDNDGSRNQQHDPYWQPDTSLHHNGFPIDAESIPYIVVPKIILMATRGVVLGCQATVRNLLTKGRPINAVVADVGPKNKIGELSPECARRLKISDSVFKGEDRHIIEYKIFPNRPAIVLTKFSLQPYHA